MLAPVTHILPLTTIRRERLLPVAGKVLVRAGQKIKPTDVVAEANLAPRHVLLDVARGLGVSREQAEGLIERRVGDAVVEGDVLASRVGLARRVVRAPVSGRIVMMGDGQLLMEAEPRPYQVIAGVPGSVVELLSSRGALVETTGALVQGIWGNGQVDFGVMRVLMQTPTDVLTSDQLDVRMRGSIVLAGHCEQEEALQVAGELALRGLILGSMAARLIPRAARLRFPVIALEGFGRRPLNSIAFKLLATNDNREVTVNAEPFDRLAGTRPEVIIPLPAPGRPDLPHDYGEFAAGQKVRIIRSAQSGAIGTLSAIRPGFTVFPSGVRAAAGRVNLEDGDVAVVPLANLEILG